MFDESNNKSINIESPAGISLIGVQALNDKITAQQTEIDALKSLICSAGLAETIRKIPTARQKINLIIF